MIVSDRYRIDARTQLPDFASDACAEGMSQRAVAGVATDCSLSMRPLAGHPHAVGLATHPPCDSTQHACAAPFPFFRSPFARALCLPARRRLSWRGPRALAGRRGTCGSRCCSPAHVGRAACMWSGGSCVRSRSWCRPPWRWLSPVTCTQMVHVVLCSVVGLSPCVR